MRAFAAAGSVAFEARDYPAARGYWERLVVQVPPGGSPAAVGLRIEFGSKEDMKDFGKEVIPSLLGRARLSAHVFEGYWEDIGTVKAFFETNNWTLEAGRLFEPDEERAGASVCVIGATVRRELFGAQDPVGTRLRLRQISCEIIGTLVFVLATAANARAAPR